MYLRKIFYTLCLTSLLALGSQAAETLSPSGNTLDDVNLYPDDSFVQVAKTIDVQDIDVSETYILVQLPSGELLSKTPTGFELLNVSNFKLTDLGLGVNNEQITFEVVAGDFFHLLDYPVLIYLGILDKDKVLHFGAFSLTANFQSLDSWDETAVRKVLHTFAFGGFASDTQIQTWAGMVPILAIQEMLSADTLNAKLSPTDTLDNSLPDGDLKTLSAFWSGEDSANPIATDARENFALTARNSAEHTWRQAVNLRGLNPARQLLGLVESNYHLSVNLDAVVNITNPQMMRYYDDIMNALAAATPYQDVLSIASLSAAVATQYNHRRNTFDNETQVFRGNEDFAREFHQIFFGIFGDYNTDYHEEITIKNTAQALTDMPVLLNAEGEQDEVVTFGEEQHHIAPLEILQQSIAGNTAQEKIQALSQYAVVQPESLENLPIILVRAFADENLDEARTKVLQNAWAEMAEKNLLTFLRNYAISTLFHHPQRFKYHTVPQRYLTALNQMTLSNQESYLDLYDIGGYEEEDYQVFRPLHDVFGAQTGIEAADSAEVFRAVYQRSSKNAHINSQTYLEDNGQLLWSKDWGSVIPVDDQGAYPVAQTVEWLWQRFLADGLKNLGSLERLHLYALLATGQDAAYALDANAPDRIFSSNEIDTDNDLQNALQDWGGSVLALDGDDSENRRTANHKIGLAINFINALPFAFGQEGQ
ncbi:DUF1800 family protein [Candidatus Venteria ishoeyi]|uniref:DUF1800 family protein n=1 Tax=Candidatus Venteria ishoeyi TaxID=1899563 RepID=UPI000CDE5793|nr:DUF1800 family protein [Candidatus Venteria ishoeyi]